MITDEYLEQLESCCGKIYKVDKEFIRLLSMYGHFENIKSILTNKLNIGVNKKYYTISSTFTFICADETFITKILELREILKDYISITSIFQDPQKLDIQVLTASSSFITYFPGRLSEKTLNFTIEYKEKDEEAILFLLRLYE